MSLQVGAVAEPKTPRTEDRAKVAKVRVVVEKANRSELSRETGLTRGYVSQVLSGKSIPSLDTAAKLSRLMRVSLDSFYLYLSAITTTIN